MAAIDELKGDGIRAILLVSSATSIAEAGFTAEGDKVKMIAVTAIEKPVTFRQVTTAQHFGNLRNDNGAYGMGRCHERFPMILKNLFNGKF